MGVVLKFSAARSGPDTTRRETDSRLLHADARGGARRERTVRYFRDSHGRESAAVPDRVACDASGHDPRAARAAVACADH